MPKLKKQSNGVPRTERPQIPDYGISKSKTGLLPWKWAVKSLTESREYWIVTVRPDGRPHAMIIWACGSTGHSGSAPAARLKRHATWERIRTVSWALRMQPRL